MSRQSASWWAKRVEELSKGGDAAEIARRHGVKASTLVWWRSELAKRAREQRTASPRLLPVVVSGSPRAGDDTLDVIVELGAARVVVRGALSADHLAALVAAARAC
jgi:transposase-like protein